MKEVRVFTCRSFVALGGNTLHGPQGCKFRNVFYAKKGSRDGEVVYLQGRNDYRISLIETTSISEGCLDRVCGSGWAVK